MANKTKKKGAGRPALDPKERRAIVVSVRLDTETAGQLEKYRADVSSKIGVSISRSKAVEKLIKSGLKKRKGKG